jgi:hypothetical protein
MTNSDQTVRLKLSIQRALLGEVTNHLVAVTCGIRDNRISIRTYMDGPCSDEDVQRVQRIAAEVIGDFPEEYKVEESCVSVGNGDDPVMFDFWAFRRVMR